MVLHPGRAHRGARCIVAVCAALMYMGSAFLVVVAFHLGAVARGPHAVENILAVDAVIVGTLAPQGVAVLRRDGQTTVLTPAIDDSSAAQAAFLHGIASFLLIIQDKSLPCQREVDAVGGRRDSDGPCHSSQPGRNPPPLR